MQKGILDKSKRNLWLPICRCKETNMTKFTTTYYVLKVSKNGKETCMSITEDKDIAIARVKAFRDADPHHKSKGYEYGMKVVKEKSFRVR